MDGPLTAHHRQFVSVLGLARIETFLPSWYGLVGRPPAERAALARSFISDVEEGDSEAETIVQAIIAMGRVITHG